ncbi:hypothetical protein GCM10007416_08170 [Kroppenstedtia guangzhouensis]|jgi:hypothetical protein|uniref:Uncharacterized protein n=1 Tax=Kroppenstedtia guangzhouensis TaxID=1274356 RepID=A0ABQ1G6C2_9BACL|nr:hypothetical protein GCM10007416_08170 [Kroppenstedtia guangzhouensis]
MLFAKGMEAEKRDEMFFARDGLDGFMIKSNFRKPGKMYERYDECPLRKIDGWKGDFCSDL